MPRHILCYLMVAGALVNYISCTNTDAKNLKTTEAPAPKMGQDIKEQEDSAKAKADYDLVGAMMDCNDTFRIEMSYLEALNVSGSFPDETDKTPKCYLKCVLESVDIATPSGEYDVRRTAQIFAGERNGTPMDGIKEIATLCAERSTVVSPGETCKCERAYNYLKCLFSMEIEKYEKNS